MVGMAMSKIAAPNSRKPTLHVECCTVKPDSSPNIVGIGWPQNPVSPDFTLADLSMQRAGQVEEWLRLNYATVYLSETLTSFRSDADSLQFITAKILTITWLAGLLNPENLDYIRVADITSTSGVSLKGVIALPEVEIDIDLFHFVDSSNEQQPCQPLRLTDGAEFEAIDAMSQAKITCLPNRSLNGLWDSLIFENSLETRLLRFVLRMISLSARQLKHQIVSWNRLLLLWGPPGTGKTTLCRALAQQLSIRLGKQYSSCKLVEVDAQSLFSRYFGESGKAVSKLFGKVESMLDEEENAFMCIFIDEVESLACTRRHSVNSNEPQDSLRAVNALLVALDRLRDRSNIIVLCTSNLIGALDPAFLDRIDKKQYIPMPCAEARYEILRINYLDLAQCGVLASMGRSLNEDLLDTNVGMDDSISLVSPADGSSEQNSIVISTEVLPPYERMMLRYFPDESSWSRKLWNIAKKSVDLSGRTLQRLPMLSLATFTNQDPCPMDEALEVLSRAVSEELLTAEMMKTGDEDRSKSRKRQRTMFA